MLVNSHNNTLPSFLSLLFPFKTIFFLGIRLSFLLLPIVASRMLLGKGRLSVSGSTSTVKATIMEEAPNTIMQTHACFSACSWLFNAPFNVFFSASTHVFYKKFFENKFYNHIPCFNYLNRKVNSATHQVSSKNRQKISNSANQ